MNLINKEVLFIDLDGTVTNTITGDIFPKGIWDMKLNFEVLDAICGMKPKYVFIVTNQGGIESGYVKEEAFKAKADYIVASIREYCHIKDVYLSYCTTNDKSDPNRKPNCGMLIYMTETYVGDDFEYIKSRSLMVGDASGKPGQFSDSDKKTAERFGCDYMDVEDFVDFYQEDDVFDGE